MGALERFFHQKSLDRLKQEAFERAVAEGVFTEWRDRYVANLCGYMRLYWEAKHHGLNVPEPFRSREWCNAAVHILTIADLEIQDYFLRADPIVKDDMVAAVLLDHGVTRLDGFFSELPPI